MAAERQRSDRARRVADAAITRRRLPDILRPGLRLVLCGINPGLRSAAAGHHFAGPGNRFWKTLHRSGLTPRQLEPAEDRHLLDYDLGLTNLVDRPSARAQELSPDELRRGGKRLAGKLAEVGAAWVGFVGVGAYRTAFRQPRAELGVQPDVLGGARIWVLPNTSGLNAHHSLDSLVRLFAELRRAVFPGRSQLTDGRDRAGE